MVKLCQTTAPNIMSFMTSNPRSPHWLAPASSTQADRASIGLPKLLNLLAGAIGVSTSELIQECQEAAGVSRSLFEETIGYYATRAIYLGLGTEQHVVVDQLRRSIQTHCSNN